MLKNYINQINSFDDFYTITSNLTSKEKGDLFEDFTKYLFMFHPNYTNITKNIWLYKDFPINLKEKLNIPNKDEGIDLITLSQNGKYYAIQCKFRTDKNTKIKWNELGTFVGLTFGVANGFENGFFVTNTTLITKNIMSSDKIIPIYGNFFDNIPSDVFKLIKSYMINKNINITLNPSKPRDYQKKIIAHSIMHFEDNARGYLEMACGTGKSLTAYWINSYMSNKLSIIAVPSLNLLSQFYNDFSTQMFLERNKHQFVLVGSDADIENEERYYNNGLLITTDVTKIKMEIGMIIKRYTYDNEQMHKLVIITTYQSSNYVIAALKQLKLIPDLCIFDEAHKTVGSSNKKFSLLLDDKNLKIKKRLFMTATPKICNGNDENETILSMNDETWYGKQIYLYNTYNAIKDKYLVDYQIVTMYTDNEYINNIITKNKYVNNEKMEQEESHYVACAIMLLNATQNKECHHLVTYHNSINKSKKFKSILEALKSYYNKDIVVLHLDGKMSMNKRNNIITTFKESDMCILTSAKVLNEGVNIPIIDGICFIDSRTSTIDIVQCIGRSLRLHNRKQMAKIFVPVLIEDINNIDENKTFGNTVRIIKSLSNTDTGINDYFICKQKGVEYNRNIIKHLNYINAEKIGEGIDINEWISDIEMRIWKKSDGWKYMYNKLKKFIRTNKRLPHKRSKNSEEKELGIWCTTQKFTYKNKLICKERLKKLEKVDYWYWEKEDLFDRDCQHLLRWINKHHKLPSQTSMDLEEMKLGRWCSTKRRDKIKGIITDDRIQKLELIPLWYWEKEDPFDTNYDNVIKFVNKNNKLPNAKSKNIKEKKLGQWCSQQKSNKQIGKLGNDKIEKLNLIPKWKWFNKRIKKVRSFDESYNDVVEWNLKYNRIPSSESQDILEKQLSYWCGTQRKNKKIGKLDEHKIKKLELLNNWYWNLNNRFDNKFINNFKKLKEYIEINNKLPSQNSKDDDIKLLGTWCQSLRDYKKKKILDDEKIKQLESLPLWYWIDESIVRIVKSFAEIYDELINFINKTGKYPSSKSKNNKEKQLGVWCVNKKGNYKIGKLNENEIKKLEELNKWHW
jgi:superfamily II DNA or RNA helicase